MTDPYEEKTVKKGNKPNRMILDDRITHFGQRLREAMQEEPTAQFARRCGLSDKAIWSYLDGLTYPSIDKVAALAHASNTSVEWLILGLETSSSTSCTPANKQLSFQQKLKTMTPEDAKLLLIKMLDVMSTCK
ncbi:helix-turn-helix transcriptional regulator [Photorhabdus tasmaniensis]